jgi:hypothetical protein
MYKFSIGVGKLSPICSVIFRVGLPANDYRISRYCIMSSLTLGHDGNDYYGKRDQQQFGTYRSQVCKKTKTKFKNQKRFNKSNSIFDELQKDNLLVSEVYNPMNLANIICNQFKCHQGALITAFVEDTSMFEYMYEFIPKDISVQVLNRIPLKDAIRIVKRCQTSTFVYDEVDPILYIVRYFSNSKVKDPLSKDPHCIEFNKNIIPNKSILDFVLGCKEYISQSDFEKLVKLVSQ